MVTADDEVEACDAAVVESEAADVVEVLTADGEAVV